MKRTKIPTNLEVNKLRKKLERIALDYQKAWHKWNLAYTRRAMATSGKKLGEKEKH